MTVNELARLIGHALSNDSSEQFQSVLWHSAQAGNPANVGVDCRDGTQFVITIGQLK